jgi:hypothetical protein
LGVDFILAGNPSGGNLGEKKKGQMKVRDDDIKKRETKQIFIMYKEAVTFTAIPL